MASQIINIVKHLEKKGFNVDNLKEDKKRIHKKQANIKNTTKV